MTPQAPECTRTQELLLDYAYGELDGAPLREVEQHLPGCPACRAELVALTSTRRVMASLSPEPAPAGGLESLLAYAEQQASRQRPTPSRPRWLNWLFAGVPVAAVVLVGVNVVLNIHRVPTAPTESMALAPPSVSAVATAEPVAQTERQQVPVAEPVALPVIPAAAPKPADQSAVYKGTLALDKDSAIGGERERKSRADVPGRLEKGLPDPSATRASPAAIAAGPTGARAQGMLGSADGMAGAGAATRGHALGGYAGDDAFATRDAKKSKAERPMAVAAPAKEAPPADAHLAMRMPAAAPPPPAAQPKAADAEDELAEQKPSNVALNAAPPQAQSAEKMDVASGEVTSAPAGKTGAAATPESLRRDGRHAEAAGAFFEMYSANPSGPRAAEALYSAALEARAAGQLARAAENFERYAREFPSANRAATALASAAEIRRSQDGEGAATRLEQNLLQGYPTSPEARSIEARSRNRREEYRAPSAQKANKRTDFDDAPAPAAPAEAAPSSAIDAR